LEAFGGMSCARARGEWVRIGTEMTGKSERAEAQCTEVDDHRAKLELVDVAIAVYEATLRQSNREAALRNAAVPSHFDNVTCLAVPGSQNRFS
jgi:hypothetical protein